MIAYSFVHVVENMKVNYDEISLVSFLGFKGPVVGKKVQKVFSERFNYRLSCHIGVVYDCLVDALFELLFAIFEFLIELCYDGV